MKEVITTGKRLVATTPEEKAVVKSWGRDWSRMGKGDKPIRLIFGDWSGYRSSQQRITHVDLALKSYPENFHGTVRFTDGTTMSVWTEDVTKAQILKRQLRRRDSYGALIYELIKSGKNYYSVGEKD